MKEYSEYSKSLQQLAVRVLAGSSLEQEPDAIKASLDGAPSKFARQLISIEKRRASGIFFTASKLARFLLKEIDFSKQRRSFFDPACGVGDLLVAASSTLPICETIEGTIELWGQHLAGTDICSEFVIAAKARLVLAALARGAKSSGSSRRRRLSSLFPKIRVDNGYDSIHASDNNAVILLNPPFPLVNPPHECTWGTGKVSEAALFLHRCLEVVSPSTEIIAILPEVLRTGTNYEAWRSEVSQLADIKKVKVYGQFDQWTDIDVFLLVLRSSRRKAGGLVRWWHGSSEKSILGEYFDVHVGSVVPHRDRRIGKEYAFVQARMLPQWTIVNRINSRRRFSGTVFTPPFVVVRRTSRPGDSPRAIGTIVAGRRKKVAVENHLIVLTPKDKKLESCTRVLNILLNSKKTEKWLDQRIRCRHLTVSALKELPIRGYAQ